MKIAGVILAGGLSRRMGGGDKSLLDLSGTSILARVVARLAPQVTTMALNANGDPARFAEFGLPVIPDSIDGYAGPLAGVLAGLDSAAQNDFCRIVTLAADTPFFPEHLVAALAMGVESSGDRLAMAVTPDPERGQNRHPVFGLWPVDLREDLRKAINDGMRKVVQWTSPHGCTKVEFRDFDFDPFFNVNTPDDLMQARKFLDKGT